jgi:hypothetical protein
MSLIEHFFKALSLYLVARIWIQICIRVKSPIRIRIKKKIRIIRTSKSGSVSNKNQNPDPHKGEKANADPHQLSCGSTTLVRILDIFLTIENCLVIVAATLLYSYANTNEIRYHVASECYFNKSETVNSKNQYHTGNVRRH